MPEALLVLGAGSDQLYMLATAHRMGLATVAVDANPAAPGLRMATHSSPIDFSRVDEVIAYVTRLRSEGVEVAGVSTMGSDVPQIVGSIARHFGWAGPSRETGELATDKHAMKVRFREAGIPVPRFSVVENPRQVLSLWQEWRCEKLVVKPTDRAGSRGVRLILSPAEIEGALRYAASFSRCGRIMVEEFVTGPQYSTEAIIYDESSAVPGFADRVYDGMETFLPNIMENGGWVPSTAGAAAQGLADLTVQAARSLGVNRGPAKGDLVLDPVRGPIVIEIAARLSGGDFCESLVPLGLGINYVETVIDIALGREPDFGRLVPKMNRTVANRYFFPPPGRLESIEGVEECRSLPSVVKLDLNCRPGDTLPAITNHSQRAGVFVVVAESRREAQEVIDTVYARVLFGIDGRVRTARPQDYRG